MDKIVRYDKGEVILTEGEFTSDAYIINKGFVEVYRAGPPEQRLSMLGPGDVFGEMALLTERPRSASVRAAEPVEVRVFDRDAFLSVWRADPDALLPLVGMLCERVRILDALVFELARQARVDSDAASVLLADGLHPSAEAVLTAPILFIEALTPQAAATLPEPTVAIRRFPFRIGRRTPGGDPLTLNELSLPDHEPYQISRSHCAVVRVGTRYFLIDRGSRLGTTINGVHVGGNECTGCAELTAWSNEVALGGADTPYRYRLTIVPPEVTRP